MDAGVAEYPQRGSSPLRQSSRSRSPTNRNSDYMMRQSEPPIMARSDSPLRSKMTYDELRQQQERDMAELQYLEQKNQQR